jgi:MFS family permease
VAVEDTHAWSLRRLMLPLYFPAFLSYLADGLTTSFIVLYALELGARPAAAGLIAALPHMGTLLFDLPAGRLIDRFNLKQVHTLSALSMGLLLILIRILPGILFFIPLLVLFGAARTSWRICQVAVVRRLVAPEIRGRSLALMGGMVRIGSFLGPVTGGYLASAFGLPALFFIAGLLLLGTSGTYILLAPSLRAPGAAIHAGGVTGALRRHARVLLTAGTGIVILGVLRAARPVLLPLYGESLGLSLQQIGLMMGVGGLADTLLFYPAGLIYDRFGIKRGAVLCLSLFSAGLLLIPFSSGFYSLLLVAALIGTANGFGSGINMILSAELAPDDEVGGFMGIWKLFTDAGILSGPLIVGLITAVSGLAATPVALGLLGIGGALYFQTTVRNPDRSGEGSD